MKKLSSIILLVCVTSLFALQGGPTQPDYIQFEPSEMKDMVSLTSGNFAYSIPLGEVPGAYGSYPLSLSYHAGVSPQQEATWVGLGWTLSPGSIVRDVRGVPDDQFHGGTLGFIYQYSAMYTWGLDLSFSEGPYSVGVNVSSTGGVGVSATIGPDLEGGSLGFTVSTNQGVGVSGGVGFGGNRFGLNASVMFSPGSGDVSFGGGVSMVGGDKNQAYKASLGVQYTTGQDVSMHVGLSAKSKDSKNFANVIGASVRKNGVSSSLGAVTVSVANSTAKGSSTSSSTGFSIVVPTNVGVFSLGFNQTLHEYHMRAATSDYVYGFLYQGGPAIIADRDNNIDDIPNAQTGAGKSTGRIPWTWTFKGRSMETLGESKMQPAYDMFTIESEGVAGTFRAFPREEHQMFNLVSNQATDDKKTLEYYHPILELDARRWPETEDFVYKDRENLENTAREPSLYKSYKANSSVNSAFADYKTHFRNEGNRLVYRVDEDYDKQPLNSGMKFLFLGEGGYYKSEMLGGAKNFGPNDVSNSLLKRVLKDRDANEQQFALYGSRKVEPIFEDVSPASKIKGFVITNSNGTKYFFTTPVKTYLKVDYTINQEKGVPVFVDKKLSKNAGLLDNIGNALSTVFWPPKLIRGIKKAVTGHLDETCKADNADETYLYTYQINMNPYATQWLLTEIQGPDYIQLDKKENDISKNIGYNVRFHYTKPSLYQWRTPYAQPNALSSDLPNSRVSRNGLTPKGCDTKMYQSAFGVKEYVYLESIETATHKVKFELNDPKTEERVDGKGWYFKKDKTEKTLPILTTAALSLRVKSVNKKADNSYVYDKTILSFPVYTATYEYDALYVNVNIPKLLQDNLKNNPKLYLTTDFYKKYIQFKYKDANGKEKDADAFIFNSDENEIAVEVDNLAENMVEKTSGDEARFGLYKIKLKKGVDTKELLWRPSSNNNMSLFDYASNGMVKIVLSENGMAFAVNNLDKTIDDNKYNLKQCIVKPSFVFDNKFTQCGGFANEAKSLITPMIDWSDIVFAENQNSPMNQMRYLKKILYYKKRKSDNSDVTEQTAGGQINKPYREYNFEYDYSLHPRTLNSYCLPNNSDKSLRYPKDLSDIQDSPIKADLNICYTDKTSRNLYGKLTLKSITEIGCQNGRCSSLPPFKFDYNTPSQTSTRFSTKDAWEETSKLNVPNIFGFSTSSSSDDNQASNKREQFYSDEYYSNITDVDASIIASENTSDEWGFWNNLANEDNRKVNQSFANYGAAAWSLNKITDPAGGVMEIKYERDVYKNGEDHSSERLYASLFRVGTCSSLINDYNMNVSIDPKYRGKACMMLLPQYWKDQCLGPRSAYWSYVRPKNYKGGMFDYMEEMGLVKDNQINQDTTVYFNLRSEVKTEVECGVGGAFDCDRFRDVGLLGSTKFLAMYEGSVGINNNELPFELKQEHSLLESFSNKKTNHIARMIVLNKEFDMIEAGIQMASKRINKDQYWDIMGVSGKMWVKRDYAKIKGGDLRVKSLVRYDIDRVAKTEYEYEPGEMSQLPDSAYTTVMGNRFNANLISYAMPDLNMKPKSRIVGFEDDDLLYVPGSTIMYPKVTVKNSDGQGKITNGKTEFEYITPERGIPEDFIDPETRDELKPFIHINANLMVWKDGLNAFLIDFLTKKVSINIEDWLNETKPYVVTFEFYDKDENLIGTPKNILLFQNRTISFNLYSKDNDDITAIRKIKAYKEGESAEKVFVDVDRLTDFNEISLTLAILDDKIRLYKNWQRSQEKGYYPILYKKISYEKKEVCTLIQCNDNEFKKADFERNIVYYDFTAFLGMNTKISFYRGNEDKAVLLKIDSSVYSTKVPDVLEGIAKGNENEIAKKIGMQVEHWNNKNELHCLNDDILECRKGMWALAAFRPNQIKDEENRDVSYYQDEVSFEYKRYPVFKTKSITMNGFDNQEKQFDKSSSSSLSSSSSELFLSSTCDDRCQRNRRRWHWSVIENHKYDPVTGNPTATLAKIPAEGGGELRKLTLKLPQHAVLEKINGNTAKPTELAQLLFKKNMLSQNYAEFVYFDSKPVDESAPWNNLKENQYLKSFSIAPLNRFKGNLLYTTVDGDKKTLEKQKYPYIDMGSFSTKSEPNQIVGTENPYFYVAKYHVEDFETSKDKWPNKRDFSGNHILQIDKYFRPVEVEDVLKRLLSAHYTDDGLHQTGLFFPSALNKTASIVPYGDEISEVNIKTSIKDNLKVDFEKGGMVVQSSINLSKSIVENGDELVAEYRYKKAGQTWQTKRENVNELNLSLSSGDALNYLRIYPENAEAKTYIYDRYGNIIQIVAEDNTSTFYEYNPLGQLIQSRNDDGVSFKSHHREFTNDDRNEIPWSESVISSSSSTSSSSSGN